jgi:ethanolamine kinase
MKKMSYLHEHFQIPLHLQPYNTKPSMWIQLDKWMSQALASSFQTQHDTQRAEALELDQIPLELAWLRQVVIPKDAPLAFCHNDLLAANILYDEESCDVHLIDFEYGGCNYCAFDIANFFNEFAGGTVDGKPNYDWYPSPQDQAELVRCYLQERDKAAVVNEDQVRAWLSDVSMFQLANHLYWGLWAVIQAASNGCQEFDYLLYGSCRIKQYYTSKRAQFQLS